jgi:hypothetical protein
MLLLLFCEQANTVPYLACCRREFCEFRPLVLVHCHASVFFFIIASTAKSVRIARVANSNPLL